MPSPPHKPSPRHWAIAISPPPPWGREVAAWPAHPARATIAFPWLLDGYVATRRRRRPARIILGVDPASPPTVPPSRRTSAPGPLGKVRCSTGMRLGEASGAALAAGIVKAALATHGGMATFGEAGVSGKGEPPAS